MPVLTVGDLSHVDHPSVGLECGRHKNGLNEESPLPFPDHADHGIHIACPVRSRRLLRPREAAKCCVTTLQERRDSRYGLVEQGYRREGRLRETDSERRCKGANHMTNHRCIGFIHIHSGILRLTLKAGNIYAMFVFHMMSIQAQKARKGGPIPTGLDTIEV